MAIHMEHIDVIVPIKIIKEKYIGGIEKCLADHKELIGKKVWYDNHLFRDGAMNAEDAEKIVRNWKRNGLDVCEEFEGKPIKWKDVCVHEMMWGVTLECDWLIRDSKTRSLYLKGTEKGEIIGRNNIKQLSPIG
jgi:hypothetical protein